MPPTSSQQQKATTRSGSAESAGTLDEYTVLSSAAATPNISDGDANSDFNTANNVEMSANPNDTTGEVARNAQSGEIRGEDHDQSPERVARPGPGDVSFLSGTSVDVVSTEG